MSQNRAALGIRLWRTWGVVGTTCGITTPVLLLHLVGTVEEWSRVRKRNFGVSQQIFRNVFLSAGNKKFLTGFEFGRGQVIDIDDHLHDISGIGTKSWRKLASNRPEALPWEDCNRLVPSRWA